MNLAPETQHKLEQQLWDRFTKHHDGMYQLIQKRLKDYYHEQLRQLLELQQLQQNLHHVVKLTLEEESQMRIKSAQQLQQTPRHPTELELHMNELYRKQHQEMIQLFEDQHQMMWNRIAKQGLIPKGSNGMYLEQIRMDSMEKDFKRRQISMVLWFEEKQRRIVTWFEYEHMLIYISPEQPQKQHECIKTK